MRPFLEFRDGVRVAGHPLHAALIHFPMALLLLVLPLEAAGWLGHWREAWRFAWLAQAAGLAFAVPAAATGLIDLVAQSSNPAKPGIAATGNLHMLAVTGAVSLLGLSLYLKGGTAPIPPPGLFATLGLSACATGLLIWGGWLGAEMVYRHRAGDRE